MPNYIAYLRGLSKSQLETEIDAKIADNHLELIHDEALSGPTADTNAYGWGIDTYEIVDCASELDLSGDRVAVHISAQARGDQDLDKPPCGDTIDIDAVAVIDDNGDVTFKDVEAAVRPNEEATVGEADND